MGWWGRKPPLSDQHLKDVWRAFQRLEKPVLVHCSAGIGRIADEAELVLLHQDAFAADYQDDEYTLLGMAIKYAGLRGKEVRVIGKNRSTLGEPEENTIQ